jgi:ABC-type branched-subunit amino acid transport system substrate-binding protein
VNDVGLDITIVTSTGNLIYGQMKAFSSFTPPNVYFSGDPAVVSEVQADKGVAAAVTTFADLLKSIGARPDQGHALSYDAAMLIINAYRKLGFDATPEQLRAELASTQNYPGIFGRFDFKTAPQRGLTRDTIIVVRWDPVKDTWTSVSKPGGAPL